MADIINGDLAESKSRWRTPFLVLFKDARLVFKMDSLGREILGIAFPAALALAADPVASLIDTAFIGRLGPVELAAVGVSIAIFNQASRVTIFPLVSITTSFVAEEDTVEKININEAALTKPDHDSSEKTAAAIVVPEDAMEKGIADGSPANATAEANEETTQEKAAEKDVSSAASNKPSDSLSPENDSDDKKAAECGSKASNKIKSSGKGKKKNIPSASTALVLGSILGILQAIFLIFSSKFLLRVMGVNPNSAMMGPAHKYLVVRSLGAPAVLLSLAMQGIFRGFKDTKTPLFATVVGDLMNIVLDPIFIFEFRLGVSGAAIAHVLSQYLISLILIVRLAKKVNLMPPSLGSLQFSRFLRNGFLLLGRVIAVTFCVTLAASMAARLGSTPMAAFQICLQVWLTSSLLADGLAVAAQAILACAFAEKDYKKVTAATSRVLHMGSVLGLALALCVGLGLYFGSGIFSKDPSVIHLIAIGIPFVAATQPINCLAFVLDGVNFGASDFAFTAYSMIIVAAASIVSVIFLAKSNGFIGIWIALTIYMVLRALAGLARLGTRTGPWKFLRGRSSF